MTKGHIRAIAVILVGWVFAYTAAYLAQIFVAPKHEPHADVLAYAGTEVILLQRGYFLSRDSTYPSIECLIGKCVAEGDKRVSYAAALEVARSRIISAGVGKNSCSLVLLEFLWRNACIDLTIYRSDLSDKEFELLLAFIRHPCRFSNAQITTSLKRFECHDGKTGRPTVARLFIWSHPNATGGPERRVESVE